MKVFFLSYDLAKPEVTAGKTASLTVDHLLCRCRSTRLRCAATGNVRLILLRCCSWTALLSTSVNRSKVTVELTECLLLGRTCNISASAKEH